MMSAIIKRGSAFFRYGISNAEQLSSWLQESPEIIGIAVVGRSNVGKSSLINSLFGSKTARTSKTPGRTREINIFTFDLEFEKNKEGVQQRVEVPPLFLFDLPGYGHAEVSKEMAKNWEDLMAQFFTHLSRRIIMINIQDARHPNTDVDQEFQNFLKNYEFETKLIFNKIDKLKTQKERAALEKIKPLIYKEYKWVKDIHFVSAENGKGLKSLENSLVDSLLLRAETGSYSSTIK
jgi:GTP-binding protein